MAVRIRSLSTSGPVVVPLSTGATVRLSPGQVTDELPDVEVANNAKVDKLRRQGLIDVSDVQKSDTRAGRRRQGDPEPAEQSDAAEEESEETAQEADDGSRAKSRKRTESST